MGKKRPRAKVHSDKPFMQMNDLEFHRAMDVVGAMTLSPLLTAARKRQDQILRLAAILLVRGETKLIITYTAEYGDNDGTDAMEEEARCIRRSGLLQPGESVEVCVFEATPDMLRCRPAR